MIERISLPREFDERMRTRLGSQFPKFASSLSQKPPISIRINPHKKSTIASEDTVPWCRYGRYLPERPNFTLDPLFHAGAYYVQEASSMLLEQAILQTLSGKPILALDLCAAPGGKSTHLLSILPANSLLVSNEVIKSRANILAENIAKWGHDNVIVTNNDPKDFKHLSGLFDLIVIDAPCSGEGLFRKDENAVAEWSVQNAELCALRQQRIFHDTWPALKPDGILIYSTCTYNDDENINNLKLLNRENRFESVQLNMDPSWGVETITENQLIGYQCYPHVVNGEGFFLSVLRKKENSQTTSIKVKQRFGSPPKNIINQVNNWMTPANEELLVLVDDKVVAIPRIADNEIVFLTHQLRTIRFGTSVATIKHNKTIPAHELAMSIKFNREQFNRFELAESEAIKYLRKESPQLESDVTGYAVVSYKGHPLGWVNILNSRVNNFYPKEWRIRIDPNNK